MRPSASPSEPWCGVVLAGGQSRRMGTDKALLPLDGRPLLDRMCEVLRQAGAARVLVSGDRPGWQGHPDGAPGLGPLGGVATMLDTHAGARLLFVAVDMPRLDTTLLSALLHGAGDSSAAHFEDHPLPLLLRATPGVRGTARALLDGPGPRSLRRLAAELGARPVALPADAAPLLFNANTPADWAKVIDETAA